MVSLIIFYLEKCCKLERDLELSKSNGISQEEKFLDEKRKNVHLEEILREQESEIRKLNMYLKESDEYSKELQKESHFGLIKT